MSTEQLPNQDQSDVDDLLTQRIRLICNQMNGNLGGFFERLRRERSHQPVVLSQREKVLQARLEQMAKCDNSSDCGDD